MDYVASLLMGGHMTYQEIADHLTAKYGVHVSRSTIAGIKRDMKANKVTIFMPKRVNQLDPIPSISSYIYEVEENSNVHALPKFIGHPEINVDRIAVASDFHSPYIDKELVQKLTDDAVYYGIDKLLIPGDLIDGLRTTHKRKTAGVSLGRQYAYTRELISYLFQFFETIVYTQGNHDDWMTFETNGEITSADAYYWLGGEAYGDRFVVSEYDRSTVYSGGQKWVVPHQRNFASNPLTVANKLAHKFQANIITPHIHQTGKGIDQYGRYVLMAIGGMFDPTMMEYLNLKTTTGIVPTPGYGLILDGKGFTRSVNPLFNEVP